MRRTTIGWVLAAVGASSLAVAGGRPTRQDLAAARRLVDRREAEAALTETRRPYVVLDLAGRRIQFRLMGMTVREIPLQDQGASGLVPARRGVATGAAESGAAILTLKEKEADPRLAPLTPEQIEAGADDENAADALPPEPPSIYTLRFKQPVALRIVGSGSGEGGVGGLLAAIGSFWGRLWDRGGRQAKGAILRLTVHLDETTARELYRTLVPGERWLVVPPERLLIPQVGQEPARAIHPVRPAPRPTPPPTGPPGVPFQIPPPVESGESGEPAGAPSPSTTPGSGDGASGSAPAEEPAPGPEVPAPPAP